MERKSLSPQSKSDGELDDFKYASPDKQRFLLYTGKINGINRTIRYETDEKLCYFTEELRPRMGKVGFIQRKATEGFTFDKTKKKLSVWFGKSLMKINGQLVGNMMKDLKQSWYNEMPYQLRILATRMLLEKIVKGSINSSLEYTTSYLKYHLKIKGIDPIFYMTAISSVEDVYKINSILRCSDDPGALIENFSKYDFWKGHTANPTIKLCDILGVKINWAASPEEFTRIILEMNIKIEALEKQYRLVQEFKGYTKQSIPVIDDNLPF
jgi:hypothetical protein